MDWMFHQDDNMNHLAWKLIAERVKEKMETVLVEQSVPLARELARLLKQSADTKVASTSVHARKLPHVLEKNLLTNNHASHTHTTHTNKHTRTQQDIAQTSMSYLRGHCGPRNWVCNEHLFFLDGLQTSQRFILCVCCVCVLCMCVYVHGLL